MGRCFGFEIFLFLYESILLIVPRLIGIEYKILLDKSCLVLFSWRTQNRNHNRSVRFISRAIEDVRFVLFQALRLHFFHRIIPWFRFVRIGVNLQVFRIIVPVHRDCARFQVTGVWSFVASENFHRSIANRGEVGLAYGARACVQAPSNKS